MTVVMSLEANGLLVNQKWILGSRVLSNFAGEAVVVVVVVVA